MAALRLEADPLAPVHGGLLPLIDIGRDGTSAVGTASSLRADRGEGAGPWRSGPSDAI